MREIKFRGKQGGSWCYAPSMEFTLGEFFQFVGAKLIDPATVGQWTGLKDKNGVDIYEGDILSVIDPNGDKRDDEIVEYKNSSTAFTIEVETNDFDITTIGWAQGFDFVLEVIGNIHEVTK